MKIEHAGIGYRFRSEDEFEVKLFREMVKRGIAFLPEGPYQDMAGYSPMTTPYIHIMPVKPEESRVMTDNKVDGIHIIRAVNGWSIDVSHNDDDPSKGYVPDKMYVATDKASLMKVIAEDILEGE